MAASRSMCLIRNVQKLSMLHISQPHQNGRLFHISTNNSIRWRLSCEFCRRNRDMRFYSNGPKEPDGQGLKLSGQLTGDLLKTKVDIDNNEDKQDFKGQENSEHKEKKDEKKKNMFIALNLVFICGFGVVGVWWLGQPGKDQDGQPIEDEFSHLPKFEATLKRAWRNINLTKEAIAEPSDRKLLPDPLPEPYYQPPYTLVLEIKDVLVHPEWGFVTGWRYQKRPGVDYFLQQCGPPLFEVVVYTSMPAYTAFPIINSLDPNGYIMYRLFRDATEYKAEGRMGGIHVKDLSCLNRDLNKVIFVDFDSKAFQKHPRNSLGLKQWTGDRDDRTLVDLATFLRAIAVSGVDDVRKVLDYYKQYDDPLEAFKEKKRELAAEFEKPPEQPKISTKWSPGFFGRR
ncbi:mitochondrial import inner membrane translocase subunit TIM50-like isoform X1 [Lingula anatina]|uniref:Mitochondrial import inner membrane translocase subunit TIM50 n=1 Tax=Lingula anatina TaxID=7574 RepID=A0A1S3I612_LINAN|nr:mitochondrial import inner membrane translocase subunit TIM50-like isoform X1 [Lingula anatina]|eukprot:XP_013393715.1 mitochondrial import inner membrane translocase subunit TIM50-like isoform X1 [Lingula anatina]